MEEEERRRKNLEDLKSKCQVERTTLKNNLKEAKETLKADNYMTKLETKKMLNDAKF